MAAAVWCVMSLVVTAERFDAPTNAALMSTKMAGSSRAHVFFVSDRQFSMLKSFLLYHGLTFVKVHVAVTAKIVGPVRQAH